MQVVQIVLWYLDSGSSKHMTGDRSQLINFVHKFLGTVKFENDHVAKIMGYGDYKIGNVTISRVYFVEGLGHNLFSVGQFCDSDLKVAFRQHTCFIRNLDCIDLLTGSRGNNLYTLSLKDMMASSPICLLSKASKTKSWLWHRRLSHLNFGAINHLARQGLVQGLPKLKFEKDHLCYACAMGKKSVNGNKYILFIVDDYSRFTWVKCLRSKDEAPDFIIKFLKMIQVRFKVGISHETSIARSPQQNGVVERRNRTLIEVARTIENLGKLKPKADIGIFIGYALTKKAFWIYNRRTRRIVETIHVDFDELTAIASEQSSSGPVLNEMTPATITVEEDIHDIKVAHMGNDPLFGVPIPEVTSAQSSSTVSPHTIVQSDHQIPQHNSKWTKDHPLDNIIVEPNTYKDALTQSCWIEAINTVESCDPVDTPMVEKSKLDEDKEGKAVDPSHYRGMIGTLLYLTASRPELQFAICMCARLPRYTRSTSGSLQFLGDILISWSSKRQKSAAISSTEVEYIALSGCCAQILWMRSQLTDYGLGFNKIPMYCVNKSAISLCCNNVQHSRSKHIDIRYHFIK
nr:hypothetical protein [Tanacetum cinerariifolium]